MEAETEQNGKTISQNDTSWSATTNWANADGSLVNSITFESTLSPTTDDDDGNRNSDENLTPKSPLVLCLPSPDQSPCEISINFGRKYEVQQVYVRSTARVYEIYYASDLKSSNEYLCTVRCGVATRNEKVLHTPDIGEFTLMNRDRECKESDENKPQRESSLSTNEDGWVEVKAFDSRQLDNGNSPPADSGAKTGGGSIMDFYEATAQITDADPCMSITLRLLSLQNKGCVFVDEIYVFGDPVEPAESENVTSQTGTDGNSLMAMFVPTFLQLSKASRIQGDHILDAKERQMKEFTPKATGLTNSANKIHQEENSGLADKQKVKLQETVGSAVIASQVEMPSQVSDGESKPKLSSDHNEKFLDHLVSRVGRIEDLLLRFEERMLKPLDSIEARLQHVEQQLEELNKKPQNSDLLCCTRISAPEFSCHELDEFFDSNENNLVTLDENGSPLCFPPEGGADLANASHSLSGLVVTAPEFSHADEEEDEVEVVADFSKDEPKRALSVDDALASALAGLLSSTSAEPQKYTQALAIKAPDFSFEEDSNSGRKATQEIKDGIATDPPINYTVTDETEGIIVSVCTASNINFLESELEEIRSFNDHYLENTREGVDEKCWFNGEGKDDLQARSIQDAIALAGQEITETSLHQITEDIEGLEASNRLSNPSALDDCVVVNQFLDNQTDDGSDSTQEVAFANSEFSTTTEVKDVEYEKAILQDIFYFPSASSIVDFELPILDVKFVSQEISQSRSFLESFWADIPDLNCEVPWATENDDCSQVGNHCNLISVDDYESTVPSNANHFTVDVDYCSLGEIPSTVGNEVLQEYYTSNRGECGVGLI